jgi:biotin transporter BioY
MAYENARSWLADHKRLLIVSPLFGGLLSFVPLYFISVFFAQSIEIDPSQSLRYQPNGLMFLNIMLVAMVVMIVIGVAIGLALVVHLMRNATSCSWKDGWRVILDINQRNQGDS